MNNKFKIYISQFLDQLIFNFTSFTIQISAESVIQRDFIVVNPIKWNSNAYQVSF